MINTTGYPKQGRRLSWPKYHVGYNIINTLKVITL